MMVSRVDMKTLDSPASTILVTNSEGARYDINGSFCFVRERSRRPECAAESYWPCGVSRAARRIWKPWESRHEDGAAEGREAGELPDCSRHRLQYCGQAAVVVDANLNASRVPSVGSIKIEQ